MTADETVRTTESTRHGDDSADADTVGVRAATDGANGDLDAVTEAFSGGAADAAVRGVDEILGREVRLVTLPPATGDALSDRIEQVRHLARLHHPHLLEVYDVDGLAPDTESTLVLESVAGEPLPLVLRDGPVPTADLARMGAQLASALAHAHAHHVEHGAIGPASILVNRAGAEAWLIGLTAALSGPLPVISETDDAAARRAADVRALAGTLADVAGHAPDTADDPDGGRLLALLRGADTALPPSAAALSERLVRFGRDDTPVTDDAVAARLVPVVASWSESPVAPGDTGPTADAAVAVGPAVHARGTAGVTPLAVVPGQRARRAGVLAAATATLALASGLVIWAGESHVVRSVPQAEVGPSAVVPGGVPGFPALAPALPAVADDSSGSGDSAGSGGTDSGEGTGTADPDPTTPAERAPAAAPTEESTTAPDPTSPVVPPTVPTVPTTPPTGPTGPTTAPTTPPSTTTTVPGTTLPGTPTTAPTTTSVPGSTTPPAGTTTTVPGTTTGGTPPAGPGGTVPTTTTTTVPVSPQANALLAFQL